MDRVGNLALGAGVTTFYHPIAYARMLIQIGFEPMPPEQKTTFFGRKVLQYPNVFRYVGHIHKTDGFVGLYRGLVPRLLSNVVNSVVSSFVSVELLHPPAAESADTRTKSSMDELRKFVIITSYESVSKCAGIIASQPLHVIVVRSMCQFVGRETKYSSISSSIREIWEHDGILGFFSGLIPRLVGELVTIWLANAIIHVVNTYIFPPSQPNFKEFRVYSSVFCQMMVNQITYPLNLISNIMAVNNSGLAAGSPPITEIYTSWWHCWSVLTRQRQSKRGAGLIWRYYHGPARILSDGRLVPVL